MNFWTKLFHRHQWATVKEGKGTVEVTNSFGKTKCPAIMVIQTCTVCAEQQAFYDHGQGERFVSVAYANAMLITKP